MTYLEITNQASWSTEFSTFLFIRCWDVIIKLFDEISKLEILKYYVIFVYFQAAVSALLAVSTAVSVLYVEKRSK
jgi:hypothetical protein